MSLFRGHPGVPGSIPGGPQKGLRQAADRTGRGGGAAVAVRPDVRGRGRRRLRAGTDGTVA
ncbi:hypothetical protein [Streptomyces tricolor]|uniref:hypothetical protein n=1 Tax=Streptomyces tricolor TaxID=68277 RepID=UPI003D70BC8C